MGWLITFSIIYNKYIVQKYQIYTIIFLHVLLSPKTWFLQIFIPLLPSRYKCPVLVVIFLLRISAIQWWDLHIVSTAERMKIDTIFKFNFLLLLLDFAILSCHCDEQEKITILCCACSISEEWKIFMLVIWFPCAHSKANFLWKFSSCLEMAILLTDFFPWTSLI